MYAYHSWIWSNFALIGWPLFNPTADYVLDLGPEGGDGGGELVAAGTPEEICKVGRSYTGQFLKELLARRPQGSVSAKKTKGKKQAAE